MTIEQRAREILSKIDESDFMAVLDRHREHPEKIIAEALRAERKAALLEAAEHINEDALDHGEILEYLRARARED